MSARLTLKVIAATPMLAVSGASAQPFLAPASVLRMPRSFQLLCSHATQKDKDLEVSATSLMSSKT